MEWPPFKRTSTLSNGLSTWEVQVKEGEGPVFRDGTLFRHPSFGMIQISRWSGGTKNRLFQSNVDIQTGISIKISRAELRRNLSTDFLYPYEGLVEVNLSPAQFSDMLVNMNTIGVPCTIAAYRDDTGKHICPAYPEDFDNELNRIEQEFNKAIKDLEITSPEEEEALKEITSRLPKKEQARLMSLLQQIRGRVKGHIPFIRDQFEESLSRTMTQAKNEFASYMAHAGTNPQQLKDSPSIAGFLEASTKKEEPDGLDR